jgi:hypothetical protein
VIGAGGEIVLQYAVMAGASAADFLSRQFCRGLGGQYVEALLFGFFYCVTCIATRNATPPENLSLFATSRCSDFLARRHLP